MLLTGMKLRHAAALALVGWYLMYPPTTPDGKSLTNAPLAQWRSGASFDTAKDCEASRVGLQKDAHKLIPDMRDVVEGIDWARCISTDDPRLKDK